MMSTTRALNRGRRLLKRRLLQGCILHSGEIHQINITHFLRQKTSVAAKADGAETPTGDANDIKDPNDVWREWLRSHQYQPIWSPPSSSSSRENEGDGSESRHSSSKFQIQPLADAHLDKITRDLLSRLDDMVHGTTRSIDIATTQECNNIIRRLLNNADSDRNRNDTKSKSNSDGKQKMNDDSRNMRDDGYGSSFSHRAYLILKKMQYCYDVRTDLHGPNKFFTYTAPKPSSETYINVLRLHAKDSENENGDGRGNSAPQRAFEIVQNMKERSDMGDWDAGVTGMFWNQVIACWANSSHPQKSFKAANIMNKHMNENGERAAQADISTYGHLFRACATSDTSVPSTKKLAAGVALHCWKELKSSSILQLGETEKDGDNVLQRGSVALFFAMKATALVDNEKTRNEALQSQFDAACRLGLVNTHVLSAFKTVAPPELIHSSELGKFDPHQKVNSHLFKIIPKDWKRNCKDTNNRGY